MNKNSITLTFTLLEKAESLLIYKIHQFIGKLYSYVVLLYQASFFFNKSEQKPNKTKKTVHTFFEFKCIFSSSLHRQLYDGVLFLIIISLYHSVTIVANIISP